MKANVARTWRSLTPNIHPPLPMTPRESQRLLSLLNASFKQQFDREHLATSSSNEHHTNLHLHSILTNPLFDAKPRTHGTSITKSQRIGQNTGQLPSQMTQPMDAFKKRVSQGTADLLTAKMCLRVQYKACMASSDATPREAMQTSGAAPTILQWLWSSGMEDNGTFLSDRKFIALLVPFLVAEGQQSRISHWLRRSPFPNPPGSNTYECQKLLFMLLIRYELRLGDGLESAINIFLRTLAELQSTGLSHKSVWCIAKGTAWTLTRKFPRLSKLAEPKPTLIDAFIETIGKMKSHLLLEAILLVRIRKPPDPQSALRFFQNTSAEAMKLKTAHWYLADMIQLGLRAAELFLEDDRQREALWIMKFLQTNYAQGIGSPSSIVPPIHKYHNPYTLHDGSESEDASLYLLDSLTAE